FIQAKLMGRAKTYLRVFIFLSLVSVSGLAEAQEAVTGIVVDSLTLKALPSVSVTVKHGTAGTLTDEKGNFSIAAALYDTLVFSLVGYQKLELPLMGYEAGIVRMNEKYTMLQAVTIDEYRMGNLYEGMFDEQNA